MTAPDAYSAKWASHVDAPTRQAIKREVWGDEYPEELDPRSFLTWSELRRIVQELRVRSEDTFLDVGSGLGGPGLWVAGATGAALVGVDLSETGVARARARSEELGLGDRARFLAADLTATGLPADSFHAAMSIDTFWVVPDKSAVFAELARLLTPGARLVFTNWDRDLSPPGYPPPLGDHRPLLRESGFVVETYAVQHGAESRRRAYYERLVEAEAVLVEEMGEEGAERLMFEAKGSLGLVDGVDYLAHSRRIFVVARAR